MPAKNVKSTLEKLYQWERERPDKVYLRQPMDDQAEEFREFTWKQAADQVRRMAAALKAMNLPRQSAITITGRNTAHWILADLAIGMAGHVSVGLYPKMARENVVYVLEHSETKVAFIGPMEDAAEMRSAIPAGIKTIGFPYPEVDACDFEWEELVESHDPITEDVVPQEDDLWTLVYTSGTTGKPKGVMLKVRNMNFAASGFLDAMELAKDERFFSYMPYAHIFERAAVEGLSLYSGGHITFLRSLETFAKQLKATRPTRFNGVPLIWTRLQHGILDKVPQKKLDLLLSIPIVSGIIKNKILSGIGLQDLEMAVTGAAPIPKAQIEWWWKLGVPLCQGYALTETACYGTINLPDANRIGSVGQALPGVEVKVTQEGEICFRSEANLEGYYKMPDKTAEAIDEDGWFHTGDQGHIDEDGYVYVTGRVKDLFKTAKGKYIAPAPIEGKLASNENLDSLCLIGAGLKQTVAIATLSEGGKEKPREAITEELKAQIEQINAGLENHEKIGAVIITTDEWSIDNGFLTPTMKIKRPQVEQNYAELAAQHVTSDEVVIWK